MNTKTTKNTSSEAKTDTDAGSGQLWPGDVLLDRRQTPLGELLLRQATIQSLNDAPVVEILLDDQMLMSSVVNYSEIALARLALEAWGPAPARVLVGGLGLGYTAQAALRSPQVLSVDVLELLEPVIGWHRDGRLPMGTELADDPRVRLLQGDFFAWARHQVPSTSLAADKYDVILLDIDHSSESLLQPAHATLYSEDGLVSLAERLAPRGLFAFWSSDEDERRLAATLRHVFPVVEEHVVEFYDPRSVEYDKNSIVIARRG